MTRSSLVSMGCIPSLSETCNSGLAICTGNDWNYIKSKNKYGDEYLRGTFNEILGYK